MTYGANFNAAPDTANTTGQSQSSLLSFLRGGRKAAAARSAGIGSRSITKLTTSEAYECELSPELSCSSSKSDSVISGGQSVSSVLQVLAASQDNLAAVTGPLSPTASREGGFFSRSNSVTAPHGAAAGRDSRSSLLARLLKVRSSTDSRPLSAVGTTSTPTDHQLLQLSSSSSAKADASGSILSASAADTAAAAAAAAAGLTPLPPVPRSNSSSMLQLQASVERKRSRFGQQGAQFLSWSVDASNLPSMLTSTAVTSERSSPQLTPTSLQQQQQLLLQQQSSDMSPGSSPGGSIGGAECYVYMKSPAVGSKGAIAPSGTAAAAADEDADPKQQQSTSKSPTKFRDRLSLAIKTSTGNNNATTTNSSSSSNSNPSKVGQSPRSPTHWKHHPWSPRKGSGSPRKDAELDGTSSASGRRSPRKSAAHSTPVHELAAAFERRCAANSPPPSPTAGCGGKKTVGHSGGYSGGYSSPCRSHTSEGFVGSAPHSPRLSHFTAQQQQQQQLLQQNNISSKSSRSSPSPKPASPFYSAGHQKQAMSAFEGSGVHSMAQRGTAGTGSSSSSSPTKQRSRVPPLSWPPKVSSAVGAPVSSSNSAPTNWDGSQQSLSAHPSLQQQQQQAESSSFGSTSGCGLQGTSACGTNSTASSSRGGSPFKPKPPQTSASPQRSRPSMVIRQTFSAPMPNPGVLNTLLPAQGSVGALPQTVGLVNESGLATEGSGYSSAAAGTAAAAGATPRGANVLPLMPLTRSRPQPNPSVAEILASPRVMTNPDVQMTNPQGQMTNHTSGTMVTPRSSPALLSDAMGEITATSAVMAVSNCSARLTPRVSTPRQARQTGGCVSSSSSSYDPPQSAAAAAAAAQQAAEMQALQALQDHQQQQQVHAMQQQLKMQQGSPTMQLRSAAAPQQQQQQQCVPIAIARHCPQDLQGPTWQPRDFIQTKKLYEGKIAAVVQGYHAASGRPLALKVYNRARLDTMERFQLAREVCLHMRSCHPSITALYAAYKDARYIYLLMELAPSGNLYQMLMSMPVPPGRPRCLPEREAVTRVIKPLLSALGYLHEQGIIHRDIKLENVLLTAEGTIKLADFGLSIDTRHEPANTRLGTQGYFAPEVLALPLKSSPFEGKSPEEAASRPSYDCKVDVWSAGVVCFEVLTGRAPFAAENVAQVLQAILHRQLVYPGHLSSDAVGFLSTALTRDPRTRPTVRELLQHSFILMHTTNQQQQQQAQQL